MKIYDKSGTERDQAWLQQEFGAVKVDEGDGDWHVAELRESEGPAATVVTVLDADGKPVQGALVARWWPDPELPGLPSELASWRPNGVYSETEANGVIGFGMGDGDYYWPPNGGASEVWIDYDGDRVAGLGMVGGTNHRHLDVVFQDLPDPPPEPEPPEPEPPNPEPPDYNPLVGVTIFDVDGAQRDAVWAHHMFGYQDVHQPDSLVAYRLTCLVASEDDDLKVTVLDDQGDPQAGVKVALGSRSIDPPVIRTAITDAAGIATFDLSDGWLRYSAVDQQGPAAVAVKGTDSDVYNSTGVVIVTPERHFDLVFRLDKDEKPPPPPPPPPPPDPEPPDFQTQVLRDLATIVELLRMVEDNTR